MGIDLNRFKGKKPNQEWLDWLADDPVPSSIRARIRSQSVRSASAPRRREPTGTPVSLKGSPQSGSKTEGNKTVSIHISVPDGKRIKASLNQLKSRSAKYKPNRTVTVGMAAVAIIGFGVFAVTTILTGDNPAQTGSEDTSVLSQATAKPDFPYSLPKGSEDQIDKEVRYDATRKVVNFVDSIGGVTITVSQQPLPEGLKDDTQDKVRKLAEDYSADHPLTTANPTAYLGTDAKGPQTVIFAKKDLLVFIQSSNRIDDHDWAEYITNLQ